MVKVDELSIGAREFYENTRLKVVASLVIASIGLMLLGFSAADGGQAEYFKTKLTVAQNNKASTNVLSSLMNLSGGFGFACFVFLLASMLTLLLAIYVSPVCCFGSKNEKVNTIKLSFLSPRTRLSLTPIVTHLPLLSYVPLLCRPYYANLRNWPH